MFTKCFKKDKLSGLVLHFSHFYQPVELRDVIGRGGYANIYSTSSSAFVVKHQLVDTIESMEEYTQQIRNQQLCGSEYVIGVKDYLIGTTQVFILMEKGSPLQLHDYSSSKLYLHLAKALQVVHSHNLVHFDVKLENVLKVGDGFKLTDFGSSTSQKWTFGQLLDQQTFQRFRARMQQATTPQYRAPEIVEPLALKAGVDEQADVFAYGVCIYYGLTGEYPFDSDFATFQCKTDFSVLDDCRLRDCCQRCLVKSADQRATITQIIDILESE